MTEKPHTSSSIAVFTASAEHTQAMALLNEWLSKAESQICSLEVLGEQLPVVNQLLESSMEDLSTNFKIITDISGRQNQYLTQLKEHPNIEENGGKEALEGLTQDAQNLSDAINKIVVGMQFQDRVSQNLVITMDVLREIRRYTRAAIEHTQESTAQKKASVEIDQEFARQLLTYLKLGELQNKFVEHLVEHGYIQSPSDIGFETSDGNSEDDIDLF